MIEFPPHFIGHTAACREVQLAYASSRMPHAWLIAGIAGVGKAPLAKHIAQFVLGGGQGELGAGDPETRTAKLVEAETHPDLLVIRRPLDEKTGELRSVIPVEEVLKVAAFLHRTATHGGWRVVILEDAHRLNRNGQNAILKIVEEPPPRTLILITVTTPGVLLPTIRSRSRALQLSPVNAKDMREIIRREETPATPEDIDAAVDLSGGSAGFALKILRTATLPLYREMLALLDAMPQWDVARLHKLADQIARKADAESFDVLATLLVERLRCAVHDEALRQSYGGTLALQIWDQTRATFTAADASNLDRKLAFINAMNEIRAAS
ncbi:MAG: DNA polymerase III subunit delta' [Alphaproteobacteria bacterium]|nr:DNA polymerase III subunit delta' [Alphaproteobacteria bacterium]